jgi:hypothetical protein
MSRASTIVVNREDVIKACTETLQGIHRVREHLKLDFCKDALKWRQFWWRIVWRFFGFSEPKLEDVLSDMELRRGDTICSYADEVSLCHGWQEHRCKKLLAGARASSSETMTLDLDDVITCNLSRVV